MTSQTGPNQNGLHPIGPSRPLMPLTRRHLLRGGALLGGALATGLAPFALGPWGGVGHAAPSSAAPSSSAASIEGQWPAITRLLEGNVSGGQLPGAIGCFGWGDAPPGLIIRGTRGFDDSTPIDGRALYRVYSMTKPLTGMVAMMLIDEGKLTLDQPLADFVPEFGAMRVVVDAAHGLDAVPAKGRITIRHLLTHSSGLGYAGVGQEAVSHELGRLGVVPARISRHALPGVFRETTLSPAEFLRRAASVPLLFEPGSRWSYSMGLDVLGLVMERITGKPLDMLMAERLFGPLGMEDSFFTVPAAAAPRLVTNYGVKLGFSLPIDGQASSVYTTPPAFAYGGSGLVTSPLDYDRFLAMLVGGGALAGTRVMSARAVALGTSNLLPAGVLMPAVPGHAADGHGAGGRVGLGEHAGIFGWAGAAGTQGFIHSGLGLRAGLFVQYMPDHAHAIAGKFAEVVRADLRARPPIAPAG